MDEKYHYEKSRNYLLRRFTTRLMLQNLFLLLFVAMMAMMFINAYKGGQGWVTLTYALVGLVAVVFYANESKKLTKFV